MEDALSDGPASICQCCSEIAPPAHTIALAAKGFSHVLSVVLANGVHCAGVTAAQTVAILPEPPQQDGPPVCKAYYKLKELFEVRCLVRRVAPLIGYRRLFLPSYEPVPQRIVVLETPE
jgi:hypothetical protein